jgi:hypothetical protein
VLVQEGKIACTSFPPRWNHVVRDVLVLLQKEIQHKIAFSHGGMMLFQDALVLVHEGKLAHARFP